jgi:tetratricopeptide (TPR) repeat protein
MWCRRHPLPAALVGLLLLSVVAGSAGVAWKWCEAVDERTNAATVSDFLSAMIADSSTDVNPRSAGFTVLQMLDRAADRLGGHFQGRPSVEASIREQIGRSYFSLGEQPKAELHLREAVKLDGMVYGPNHPATLNAENALAAVLGESGHTAEAEALLRRNLGVSRSALGPRAETTLETAGQLGVLFHKQGRFSEAEPLLRQTLENRRRVLRAGHPDTLRSVRSLCRLCVDRGRFSEAEALADEYERGIRCAWGQKHPENVNALANRGLICILQGRAADAEPFYRRAEAEARRILGPDHPRTNEAALDLARLLHALDPTRGSKRQASRPE